MKEPRLNLIENTQGADEALVFINGYLSEKKSQAESNKEWKHALRKSGWRGSIYHLWWDASNFEAFFMRMFLLLKKSPLPTPNKLVELLVRSGISMTALYLHWKKVKRRAKVVGQDHIPQILETLPESGITLMGFSLGALVAYKALLSISPEGPLRIKNVILLAATISRDNDKEWGRAVASVSGKTVNIYKKNDYVLKYLFKIAQLNPKSPCGIKPIKYAHHKLVNVDATALSSRSFKNHWEHLDNLSQTVGWLFHK